MTILKKEDRIYVAGHKGMVGSAILYHLKSQGFINIVTRTHGELDLINQRAVGAFFQKEKIDHVILAAAKVGGIYANNRFPAEFIYTNLMIQNNVIHQAYLSGVKDLLFLGSSCIYPKFASQPLKEEYLLTGTLEPTNEPYAVAKISGIKLCESYNRQYQTRYRAVMPTNLYGPNDNYDLKTSHVLPAMIRKFHLAKLALEGNWDGIKMDEKRYGPIPEDIKADLGIPQADVRSHFKKNFSNIKVTLWGTGSVRREFLHVDDMVRASLYVMNLDGNLLHGKNSSFGFFNIGTGTDLTIAQLAKVIKDVVGFNGSIRWDRQKPDGTPRKLLDVSALKKLGWSAKIDLLQGIKKTYEAYLKQTPHSEYVSVN